MNISMKTFYSLSYEEIYFLFTMLRKYGGLVDPSTNQRSENKKKRRPNNKQTNKKYIPNGHPNLFDLSCSSWDGCEDKKFLLYREIVEQIKSRKKVVND